MSISAIIPTIGRPNSLRDLLESLAGQTAKVDEILVADGSSTDETLELTGEPTWNRKGLEVKYLRVSPPNAVRQRQAAISHSRGDVLLFLDDDVVLEPDCVERMVMELSGGPDIVAVMADFNNQSWSRATTVWRLYLRYVLGMKEDEWQGRVVGPLLRFGYFSRLSASRPIEWLGTGNSLVRRVAFESAGGFSAFFLHRCTLNEDVDIGLKLSKIGQILFCPLARMAHHHAPGGRVSARMAAEDDLFNRFCVLHRTMELSSRRALLLVSLYLTVETASNFLGCLRRFQFGPFFPQLIGRGQALVRILLQSAG